MRPGHPYPGVTYFCLDADGRVIYVGSSIGLKSRLVVHRGKSPWWPSVAEVTTVEFDRWEDAVEHETQCISILRPINNKIGNPDWVKPRKAVAA